MHKKYQKIFEKLPPSVLCRISLRFSWWSPFGSTMKIRVTSEQNVWYTIKKQETSELLNAERFALTLQRQYAQTLEMRRVFE